MWALRKGWVSTHTGAALPPRGSRPDLGLVSMSGIVREWHFMLFSMPHLDRCHMTWHWGLTSNIASHANVRCASLANNLHWLWGTSDFDMEGGGYTWSPPNVSHVYIKMPSPARHGNNRTFTCFNILMCHLSLGINIVLPYVCYLLCCFCHCNDVYMCKL